MAATPTPTSPSSELTDGPVLTLMTKRLRALKKKLNRITQMEESLTQGKTLNKEQSEVLKSKSSVLTLIDEYDKLRQPLVAALHQELIDAKDAFVTATKDDSVNTSPSVGDASVKDLVKLVYFGSLFDVKQRSDYENTMLMKNHERGCCLTYDYVTEDAEDVFLEEKDLDLLSVVMGLVTSRPGSSALSHKDALEKCFEHAKLWLGNSGEKVGVDDVDITYAGLRGRLNKILNSEYFTTTPELKAPTDVAAACQVAVEESLEKPAVETESYEVEDDESSNVQGQETETAQSTPVEELPKDEPEQRKPLDTISTQQDQQYQEEVPQEQGERDVGSKDHFQNSRRTFQNQRGGGRVFGGGGGRRGYSNGRGGGRNFRDGGRGYQNGRPQYYEQQQGNYSQRTYYPRDGTGGVGAYNNHRPATRPENSSPDQ